MLSQILIYALICLWGIGLIYLICCITLPPR